MKLLLDTCVWGGAGRTLVEAGHDVITTSDYWENDPGDEEILARAHAEDRVLVTLDKDFGELAVVYDLPHTGIIRLVNMSGRKQGALCAQVLERYQQEIERSAIITVERDRVRVRLPEN